MKYQKIAECPSELLREIELSNYVSVADESFLPIVRSLIEEIHCGRKGKNLPVFNQPANYITEWQCSSVKDANDYWASLEQTLDSMNETIKRFPKLHRYIFEESDYYDQMTKRNISLDNFDENRKSIFTFRKYEDFLESRQLLRFAAQCGMYYQRVAAYEKEITFSDFNKRLFPQTYFGIFDGRFYFSESKIQKVISGADPLRLRICPICRDVFWAKRMEAPTCLEKRCSNNFHQRKLRIKEYETRLDDLSQKLEAEKSKLEKQQNSVVPLKNLVEKQKIIVRKLAEKKKNLQKKIVVEKGINDNL